MRFVQRSLLVDGGSLTVEGFQLLDRQLPHAQLIQQRLDRTASRSRVRLADQHIDALHVELTESRTEFLAGLDLNCVALMQEFQHRAAMRDVAEVRAEHRIERLCDQLFHIAESLNDARSFLVVDVDDDGQRQHRLVGVFRHEVDGFQALVVTMRLGFASDPVQHEVRRRDQHDAAGVGVEGVLAGAESFLPHAALAFFDTFAVTERRARQVAALLAVVADDDTDMSDRHDRFRDHAHVREPAVDEVGAVGQRSVLPPASATGREEFLRVLEVVVVVRVAGIGSDGRRDDLSGQQRWAVLHGHDADAVHDLSLLGVDRVGHFDAAADDHRIEAVDFFELCLPRIDGRSFLNRLEIAQHIHRVLRDDDEQRRIDGVDTFTQDRSLSAALTACVTTAFAEERSRVLKVVAGDNSRECLAGRQWLAVASVDVADLPLRNRHEPHLVNDVLPAP